MTVKEKLQYFSDNGELRRLILENPDLPIVVLTNEDSHNWDSYWMFCTNISYEIKEILDCDYSDYNDVVFTDKSRLEEKIADDLYDEYCEKSDEEYNAAIKQEVDKYEPYWKKVIAIYATN